MSKKINLSIAALTGAIAIYAGISFFSAETSQSIQTIPKLEQSVVDFKSLNKDSLLIASSILNNKDAREILTPSVIKNFIINGASDFNSDNTSFIDYIKLNEEQIVLLLTKDTSDPKIKRLIDGRMNLCVSINKNLKFIFELITNFNSKIKSLNKKLLELDFIIKEKISIWTFISKQNHIETNGEKIINNILKSENSLENKLKFLFDGWLDKNTVAKLEILYSIDNEFNTVKQDLDNIDKIFKKKYPDDYKYSENYLNKIKNNK